MSLHRPTNPDNHMKCDVAGHKGWKEVNFHLGKNPDGSFKTAQGFKNVLTDEEHIGDRPPGATGDMPCVRHNSEAYRRGYDLILWDER